MQFDDVKRSRAEEIFAGNVSLPDDGGRYVRIKSEREHPLRGRINIFVAKWQIEVHITAHRRIVLAQQRNQRPLDKKGYAQHKEKSAHDLFPGNSENSLSNAA